MTVVYIAIGAAVGAPLRYLLDRAIHSRHDAVLPWGTLCVNILGCLLLGTLTGMSFGAPVMATLGVGLCGALSTYSTFGYESLRLVQQGARGVAMLSVGLNVVLGVLAAFAGMLLGHALG